MAVLKVENFGGVMPSVSPRALSADAAQTNQNLFSATREFRPLAADTAVTTGLSGAKTLYRIDATSAWVVSASELSYARGQINDDVTKRTYYSNNTTASELRTFDKDGNDRRLGVPAPTALTVTTTQGETLTSDSLIEVVRAAIENSINIVEPAIRYSGSTILAGPLTNPGLFFATDTTNLPTQVTNQQHYWSLYAKVPITRVLALQINLADIAVAHSDDAFAYIPIVCLPYTYVENGVPLATSLPAIVNPRTNEQVIPLDLINALIDDVRTEFDVNKNAYHLRTELTNFVTEFYNLLFVYPAEAPTTPGVGTVTDPTGPGPTAPTGPYWERETEGGPEYKSAEWELYEAQVAEYDNNVRIYNENKTLAAQYNRSATDRIRDLQNSSENAARQIEAIQLDRWNVVAKGSAWTAERVYRVIAAERLTGVDPARSIQTRFYLVTFVTDRDEESAPSPPSAEQTVDQYSGTVVSLPTVPSGRFVQKWRIYRSASTAELTTFQFVTELPISTTTYADEVSNEALREMIPTVGWDEPVTGLKGLVGIPNGIMAAFKENTIHFCEPYAPYAFPPAYQITTQYPIVGLGVFGQTLFVGTTGSPYLISGSDSASMSSIQLESTQSCVSRRSIASVPGGVLYASPDGLCFVDNSGVRVVTRALFTREDWQKLKPESMFGTAHEDIYYFFYDTGTVRGAFAYDTTLNKLGTVGGFTNVTALYVDREADEFFANDGTSVNKLFSAGLRTAVWKSPLITLPAQTPLAWLKVYGGQSSGTPVIIRWYADGALRHTATLTNIEPVRLPPGRWLEHEIEVESAARVTKLVLTSSTQELQGV
jgi:hypothetical protein